MLRSKIDALGTQLNALKVKIDAAIQDGPEVERRMALRTQLDEIKGQQSGIKGNRAKILDQLKGLQDVIQRRTKDLNAAKQKAQFKSVEDIDSHIRNLDRQIEAGTLNLTAEKKALASINEAKRLRRAVEGFQTEQTAIDADKAHADELRKKLDDPESKAISDKYETIKTELDELNVLQDEVFANRNKLFDQRKELQSQLDELWTQKKESAKQYREAQDRYHKKVQEERAKRAERLAAQRAEAEAQKRREIALRLREEAEIPAFQAQVEDCQTLINFFIARIRGTADVPDTSPNDASSEIAGVPKLETRAIDKEVGDGLIVRKKKGDNESNYFVGGKGKKKTSKVVNDSSSTPSETRLQLPLSTLSALLSLSIPPPTSHSDVNRAIEDLKIKKAWFEANQARVTAENIAKADAKIKKLGDASSTKDTSLSNDDAGDHAVEAVPTPAHSNGTSNDVAAPVVDEKPEVKEAVEAA